MVQHARLVGITMDGLDHRIDAAAGGARSFLDNALLRDYARHMVGVTQRPASTGTGTQRR
jgi:hypothetical protein